MSNTSGNHTKHILWMGLLVLFALLSACSTPTVTPTPTPSTPTPTPEISPTPTLGPLGGDDNPLVIGFDTGADPTGQNTSARQDFTDALAAATGYNVTFSGYSDPRDLMDALKNREVDLAWLHPLTYIYAREKDLASVGLLSNHFGTYFYGTQFLANAESGYTQFYNTDSNSGTADAATALAQFDGTRPCWVEPGSISGFIYPDGLLEQAKVEVQSGVLTQSFTATIRSLYIKGICDFGVTFAISGDPRTSSAVTSDLTDVMQRVVVVWQSNAEIPNLNLSYSSVDVPESLQRDLNDALVKMMDSEDNRSLLSQALNGYDIQGLKIVDDSIYDPLRQAVDLSGTDVSQWIGR